MRVIFIDRKNLKIKLVPETYDDVWHLSHIIGPGDFVTVRTYRTYKPSETAKPEKKPVTLTIEVEKVEFNKEIKTLRVLGKIVDGSPEEFVQRGSYHSSPVELGEPLTIGKKELTKTVIETIESAVKHSKKPVLGFVLIDDEKALCAIMKVHGVDVLTTIYSNTSKRDPGMEEKMKRYLNEIAKVMETMDVNRYIVAGPGFTKDELVSLLEQRYPELAKKVWTETCSYVEPSGIEELIKKDVVSRVVGEHQLLEESKLMELVNSSLGRGEGKVVYGIDEVERAVGYKMVSDLLVSVRLLHEPRIKKLMDEAEKNNTRIHVFSDESQPGQQLLGLGGLVAILYYSVDKAQTEYTDKM